MRSPRKLIPGGTYHVTARINNHEFRLSSSFCKSLFLDILTDLQSEMGFKIEHFSIMDNHFHLIIKTIDMELPTIMKRLLMTFTIRYNKHYGRTGHIWGDRYFSEIINEDIDFERCFNYISENAVSAELVKNPLDWKWSGIAFYLHYFDVINQWISDWVHEFYKRYIDKCKKCLT